MALDIQVNLTQRFLQVGNYVQSTPQVVDKSVWPDIAAKIQVENPTYDFAELNSDAMFKMYRDAALSLWIKPQRQEIMRSCLGENKKIDPQKLIEFWRNSDYEHVVKNKELTTLASLPQSGIRFNDIKTLRLRELPTLEHQDMAHLMPMLAIIGEGEAKAARKVFGKSLWSAFNKNTLEKNEILAEFCEEVGLTMERSEIAFLQTLSTFDPPDFQAVMDQHVIQSLKEGVVSLRDIAFGKNKQADIVKGMNPWQGRDYKGVLRLIVDVAQMSRVVDEKPKSPSNLAPSQLQRYHDDYITQVNRVFKKGNQPIGAISQYSTKLSFSTGKAYLLKTPAMMAEEGERMNHCVGGYARRAQNGNYIAYHLIDSHGKHSTLGITLKDSQFESFNQHFGPSNRPVNEISEKLRKEVIADVRSKSSAHYSSAAQQTKAEQSMYGAYVDGNKSVEERMKEAAERLSSESKHGAASMEAFLNPETEVVDTVAETQELAAKGVGAYVNAMSND